MKILVSTRILGALALFALLAPAAIAVPLHYTVSGGTVTGRFNDPGLVINVANDPGLPGTSFTLNDGQSKTFNFFDIWTDETTINPDDTMSFDISATLNFSDPVTGGTVHGITFGGSLLFGLAQWGQVTWDGPTTVTIGDRIFTIALTNEIFNFGIFGLSEGLCYGATVEAIITQVDSRSVPDSGSTLMLSGMAFAGLLLMRRKSAA